jgi:hypothetical protein
MKTMGSFGTGWPDSADADELAEAGPRHADSAGLGDDGQSGRCDRREPRQTRGMQRVGRDVGQHAHQVAHMALRVDEARLFHALAAVANQLHAVRPG